MLCKFVTDVSPPTTKPPTLNRSGPSIKYITLTLNNKIYTPYNGYNMTMSPENRGGTLQRLVGMWELEVIVRDETIRYDTVDPIYCIRYE
jgi:hypothetical protein